jgi:hypothetical protein
MRMLRFCPFHGSGSLVGTEFRLYPEERSSEDGESAIEGKAI